MRRFIVAVLIAATAALSGGCAYYNTFYLAKKYYKDGYEKEHRSNSDKLPPEAATMYDKSIEMSAKVISRHGHSRWVDDAIYLIGLSLFGKRDFDGALRKFEELPDNYPKSKLVPDAKFMSGICYQKKRNFAQANSIFTDVLRDYPKFERRDEVLLIVARGSAEEKRSAEAIATYRELIRRYKGSAFRNEACLEMGDLYLEAGQADSARMAYEEGVRYAGDGDTKAKALLKLARSLAQLQRHDDATKVCETALGVTKSPELLASVRLEIGATLEDAKRYDAAIAAYQDVIVQHAHTSSSAQAQYQIGYIDEVYRQDPTGAREAYDKVKAQDQKSAFVEQAALRSKNLEKMQQYSLTLGGAGNEAAAAAFKLAELNFFQLEKPDSALKMYTKVENDFASSPFAPRAAFARAWILQQVVKDSAASVAEYQHVVDAYPRSLAAVKAREVLGLPPAPFAPDTTSADTTRADSLGASARADSAAAGDSVAVDSTSSRTRGGSLADSTVSGAPDSLRAREALPDSLRARAGGERSDTKPALEREPPIPPELIDRLTPAQLDSLVKSREKRRPGKGAQNR